MSIELSAVRMWRVSWRFFKSIVIFVGGALAIAAGASALGAAVAGIVVVVLAVLTPVQGRILDRSENEFDFVVTDDLARLCEGSVIERSEIFGSNIHGVTRNERRKDGAILAGLGLPREIAERWTREREQNRRKTGIEEAVQEEVCARRRANVLECEKQRSDMRFAFEDGIDVRPRRFALRDGGWWGGR